MAQASEFDEEPDVLDEIDREKSSIEDEMMSPDITEERSDELREDLENLEEEYNEEVYNRELWAEEDKEDYPPENLPDEPAEPD